MGCKSDEQNRNASTNYFTRRHIDIILLQVQVEKVEIYAGNL